MLTDQSPMPFGRYIGEPMEKVPAKYLLFLWDKPDGLWQSKNGYWKELNVRNYIIRNFNALETECPDLIIKHRP